MKKLILLLLFIGISEMYTGYAQRGVIRSGKAVTAQDGRPVRQIVNPWHVGGGLGLDFGSDSYFGIHIAPFVGYEITPQVEIGLSAGYQYSKWRHQRQHYFNFGPFVEFYPIRNLFLRTHYEYYTGTAKYKDIGLKESIDENALWLGAGYRTPGPVSFYFGLMYDVLYKSPRNGVDRSIFDNGLRPIVGVSVAI